MFLNKSKSIQELCSSISLGSGSTGMGSHDDNKATTFFFSFFCAFPSADIFVRGSNVSM